MNTTKITNTEITERCVASLPTRPTSSSLYGGHGLSSSEMKAAFDKLPLHIIEKFNSLLDDISALGEGSLASEIPTGIEEGHTLSDLFSDIENGNLASRITVDGEPLTELLARISEVCGL